MATHSSILAWRIPWTEELHGLQSVFACSAVQSCLTLCSPMDCSPACQASLSMGFPRQQHWSRLPCPLPGDLPSPGIEPTFLTSPALADGCFTTSTRGLQRWGGGGGQRVGHHGATERTHWIHTQVHLYVCLGWSIS